MTEEFTNNYDESVTESGLIIMQGKPHPEADEQIECLPSTPDKIDSGQLLDILRKRPHYKWDCDCRECTMNLMGWMTFLAEQEDKARSCDYSEAEKPWPVSDDDDQGQFFLVSVK